MKKTGELFVGTSGYVYPYWIGVFYPSDLPSKDYLKFFSKKFKTTEINYSFYHLPRPSTYQKWYKETPKNFLFTLKASRFITHIKRLKGVKMAWRTFLSNALELKEKLGPILFQFPPSFKKNKENFKRLKNFLSFLRKDKKSKNLKYAFEFRNESWCQKEVYDLLKKFNCSFVIADSPKYPKCEVVTADFVYIRMHGGKILYGSEYSEEEMKNLAEKIKKYLKKGLDTYVYFNNDFSGFALKNAKQLIKYLKK